MLKKITFLILFQITLFGSDLDIFEYSFHGNFCGYNIPFFKNVSKAEEIAGLQKIKAVDSIDLACKNHDICYVNRGYHNESCDKELIEKIQKIHPKLEERNCKMLTKAIVLYFYTKNNNFMTVLSSGDDIGDKLFDLPKVSLGNMFDMGSFSSDLAMNFGYNKPMNYIFDSKNNKQRLKDVLQVFPPRHTACIVGD